ncbi:MAG: AraC family transcriptional regulator [Bacteroidota bacterium]|nr:AraC family transcriptional regulator [Bacteroidota bacterium]
MPPGTYPAQPAAPGSNSHATVGFGHRAHSKAHLLEDLRQAVVDMVLTAGGNARMKNSEYLSRRLRYDYTYLANLFSEITGGTIEQYIIGVRINCVKELLSGPLTLTQIADQLCYSSVAHLSNQFKKVTGRTPSSLRITQSKPQIISESGNDVTAFCNCVNTPQVRRVSFAL